MRTFSLIILIAYSICDNVSYSQFGDLQIKSRFDEVYNEMYGPIYNIGVTNNDINAQGYYTWDKVQLYLDENVESTLGSSRSGSLNALLRMYEATCDVKYLYEFMEQSTIIMNARADRKSPLQSTLPYWFKNSIYCHGRILMATTHFVHLVKSSSTLNSRIIPTAHRSNFANKATFGEYADWLNNLNRETMDFLLTKLWRSNTDECMCKIDFITDNCNLGNHKNSIYELNKQAPFGCALIYLYLVNTNELSYGSKAVEMARAYLTSSGGILSYHSPYNSYYWYHYGWQRQENGNLPFRTESYIEDVGHGGWDILFPYLYNKYESSFYQTIIGGHYFEYYQMVRFKNAFSKSILSNTQNPAGQYYGCNIAGTFAGVDCNVESDIKLWTRLSKFDDVVGGQGVSIYSFMMNHYQTVTKIATVNDANFGGLKMLGLADMAYANYEKEKLGCFYDGPPIIFPPIRNNNAIISPNPADNSFGIESSEEIDFIVVQDFTGKLIYKSKKSENYKIDDLVNGAYIVRIVFTDGSSETLKLNIRKN